MGKKRYFYLLYFHCLFSYDCTVCQQPRGHFDACFDAMVYCVAQLSLWFSFQIWAGILGEKEKTKPKIKLFYNYGYLMKSAFVTAAGVLEISVCKYLYILICFQPQRCFCLSVFLTPGHSCKQPCLPAHWAALPREDTSLSPSLSAWYNFTFPPLTLSD